MTWNSIWIRFVKKASMSNTVKSLAYIKHYSLSSPRPVKCPCSSIRYNCQKICDWSREDLKPYWKSEKRPNISKWSTILLFTSLSKTLLTTGKILTGQYFLAVDFSPTFLYTGTANETCQQSGKKNLSDTYWRAQLLCTKVQTHSSLEPPLECNHNHTPLMNQGSLWPF